ncbi:TRAP transporter large permease [Pseudooceanicola sediminis]|uniref:TRAP transporter large permease protein n=1 Tax=Pseudooceanicola sediminis TaxID=2211117 RepID=A0A399J302_9RHOB|nr:TRAP transporter large permease [Pseudooceanicola sediminis]KAA2317286.1 TRAP transporter large permease [Puniceibacterium sp. HSS470]RII39640.1 TRAP transporter large permease [Pseudooceanicola sediminis]|tara:strand:- start:18092 stop:19369 length:1278 start_codon:yes stop_codon:yes gene_type:complete
MTLYLVAFVVFMIVGVPIAFSLGLASVAYLLINDQWQLMIGFPQKMIAGIDSFVLLTIPFFILAGNLMNSANLTRQIVRFAQMLVGRVKGGLAVVNVVSSMMFSGVSGAATAEASAIGSVMIPAMAKDGYRPEYAAALTATGSILGPLVPPSLSLILYGVLTGTSISDLFLAGIVPAFLLCGLLILYALWRARVEDHPIPAPIPKNERVGLAVKALPALFLPVIIVGGIRSGVFTPTEAAAVAALYALLIGGVLYRTLSGSKIAQAFYDTATMTAGVMLIVAMASMTAFILGIENIPRAIALGMRSISEQPWILILLLNMVLLVLGLFLEPLAALVLAMPILNEVFPLLEINAVQFGVMVVLNLMIGMITPPVGLCLFIVAAIGKQPLEKVARAILPMIGICLIVLGLIAFVPFLTLSLPAFFGG